ncbi:hypothetical protein NC651_026013 [Populus alba x Populus x berolinensis]|nr:hypothetical protein NC651_026013 [Populus alba x Populus x berolinensis]
MKIQCSVCEAAEANVLFCDGRGGVVLDMWSRRGFHLSASYPQRPKCVSCQTISAHWSKVRLNSGKRGDYDGSAILRSTEEEVG